MDRLLICLRAAAEPTRMRILAICSEGDVTVSELTRILAQSQPRVSRHLKLLCDAGLLDRFREGSWVFYRLSDGAGFGGRVAGELVSMIPDGDAQLALDRARLQEVKAERAEHAGAYFRANAERWDRVRSLHVEERKVEEALLEMFPAHCDDLLDIGTGTGRMLQLFSGRIARGVGIDSSRDMLAVARANIEARGLRHCQVRHGDMYGIDARNESFDAAVIHQVLHYADRPESVVAEAARVLRPHGCLLIVDFAPHTFEALRLEHAHRRLGFSRKEIFDWCSRAGLEPGEMRPLSGAPLTVNIWSAHRAPAESGRSPAAPDTNRTPEAVE